MKAISRPPAFVYDKSELKAERASLTELVEAFGTPLYVYSTTAIKDRFRTFEAAFAKAPHSICYSVKANSNLSILRLLCGLGAGFDVVSGGELERVLSISARAARTVVFSGVAKTAPELDAALRAGILIFNVESESELFLLSERAARLRKKARVALRVNPDVVAETHPYISTGLRQHKFGIDIRQAPEIYARAAREKYLDVAGVSVHIGSQITTMEPFAAALKRVAALVRGLRAAGHDIRYVDAGGGLGIPYGGATFRQSDFTKTVNAYKTAVARALHGLKVHLLLEPGRAIVGPAGALITRILYTKDGSKKRFLVVDAGMNDLIRPSLYGAYHEIVPVRLGREKRRMVKFDVVGPVCETGDFFARDREMPEVAEGDLLAILDAGAYGMSLASNYNSRPRAAEVLVNERSAKLIRKRETMNDLMRQEL